VNKDILRLIEKGAMALDREILKECEKRVRHTFCRKGEFCEKFDHCDIAQHDMRMMRLMTWQWYAGKN
jgi:hypothetical protein